MIIADDGLDPLALRIKLEQKFNRKISLEKLAEIIGISFSSVEKYSRKSRNPSGAVRRLCFLIAEREGLI
jgi:transcriptional regulator with XRE-family HTH domain